MALKNIFKLFAGLLFAFYLLLGTGLLFAFYLLLGTAFPAEAGIISKQQEIEMGRETAMALEAQYGVVQDYELQERVNRIGQSLVAVSDRQDLEYTFKVLNCDEVNALVATKGDMGLTGLASQALAAGYSRTDERGADKEGFNLNAAPIRKVLTCALRQATIRTAWCLPLINWKIWLKKKAIRATACSAAIRNLKNA